MTKADAFSTAAWRRNNVVYEKILAMPFNAELQSGTLSVDRFRHYMIQDAHYLEGFARALSLASGKGLNTDHVVLFAEAARTAIVVERSLHANYFATFGVSQADFNGTLPTPACDHYVSYLLRVATMEPFDVVLAALLPCFWIYREVGKHIHANAARPNVYQAWIETYAGAEFEAAVDAVIAATDRVAEGVSPISLEAMHRAFSHAMKLEWMFWDCAYRMDGWRV